MTHGYTAWHAIVRLLDDIALVIKALRANPDSQPRHQTVESPPTPERAGSDFPPRSWEEDIGENHIADLVCPVANDNCSAASGPVSLISAACSGRAANVGNDRGRRMHRRRRRVIARRSFTAPIVTPNLCTVAMTVPHRYTSGIVIGRGRRIRVPCISPLGAFLRLLIDLPSD
jgi:hypothetical protein